MADEEKFPQEAPTPIDPENPPEPIEEMQAKTIREIRAETVAPKDLPEGARELREAEEPEAVARRREIEQALDQPINAIEDAVNRLDRATTPRAPRDVLAHPVPDTTNILGRWTVPLSIYDVVYISLAIFTLIELLIGELFPGGEWLAVIVLLAIAAVKAFHVVWYYMHLAYDSRIFWLTLAIPFLIGGLGLIFLMIVPPFGY